MREQLRILLCGEGLALSAVIEHARQRGHQIEAVFATSATEAHLLRQSGYCVSRAGERLEPFAAARPYDLLLSVNNGALLAEATIRRAAVAAINYHNAPLPAYAGLRATAWAVFNGESQHGITWHRIEPGIDTGNILVQRHFALAPHETTATLNARCTDAAIESLDALFSAIESRQLDGRAQDFSARSYFRRADTVPGAGLIDWRWPGVRIDRLIRACDWGGVPNDFGTATVALPGRLPRYVLQGQFDAVAVRALPGEVLGVTEGQVQVACADGVMTLRFDQPAGLARGDRLPPPEPAALQAAKQLHRAALAAEPRWLPALRSLAARPLPQRPPPCLGGARGSDPALALAAAERVFGGNAVVALAADGPASLTCGWLPLYARGLPGPARPAPLRDAALRHPALAGLDAWWQRADVCVGAGADPADASPAVRALQAARETLRTEAGTHGERPSADVLDHVLRWMHDDPHAGAIEDGATHVTRRALVEQATALAQRLLAARLRPRAGVGILLGKSADFVVAALGAMLARGAYVPLNLDSPDRRRVVEVAEGGITHLLTTRTLADALPALEAQVLCLEDTAALPPVPPLPAVRADDAAYRIFTSGSTGRPKAVEVTHAALDNLVAHYRARLGLGCADRASFLAHPTFDASVADLWPMLAAGGTVVIPPPQLLLDPLALIDWLGQARITQAFVPTAIGARLIGLPWPPGLALRHLLTGGEMLHRRPLRALPFELINTYGPTENTVDSLWAVVTPGDGPPPIGRPIAGVTAQVIDAAGQVLPPGAPGELLLGGRQLARGYFGQPALTAEKFPQAAPGMPRGYRTGDRVRRTADGEFHYLGRLDEQVQLHGIRVEPGEIEAVLRTDARVREAVCLPCYEGKAVTALSAHVAVAAPGAQLAGELRALLRAHLVPALVPATLGIHAALPRTPAGKIDRAALTARTAPPAAAPAGDTLAALWHGALPEADAAGAARSFWELGGTSIGAMTLLLAVHERTGVRVPVAHFLAAPTLSSLRQLVQRHAHSTVVKFRAGTGTPLILWYGLSGDLEVFQHLVREDLGDRPVWGVMSPVVLAQGQLPTTLEEAVRVGLAALHAHGMPRAPAMAGFSWGGLLAFEAARQLAAAGDPAACVCLIGTHPPVLSRTRLARLGALLRAAPLGVWRQLRRAPAHASARTGGRLRRLVRFLGARGALPPAPDWPAPIYNAHAALGHGYTRRPRVPVDLLLVRDLDNRDTIDAYGYVRYDKPDYGWAQWTGRPVTVHWVPGDHVNALSRAHAGELAALLRAELAARTRPAEG